MTNLDSILKSRDITLPTKMLLVKALIFPAVIYGCEIWTLKSWVLKNWCFWTVVLDKACESHLDYKEIQPIHSKGNQSWISFGRNDAKAENPILWPPDEKKWLMRKDPDSGKDWRREDRAWDGWMTSQTLWTWVWVSSGSSWWTGKPGVLQSMGLQSRTALCDWTELIHKYISF